jgi:hypothetical protein
MITIEMRTIYQGAQEISQKEHYYCLKKKKHSMRVSFFPFIVQ